MAFKLAAATVAAALLLAAAAPAPKGRACPTDPLAPGAYSFNIESDGLTRTFLVNVPSNYTNVETPMLILYHGFSNTAVGFNRTSGATIVSEEEGFIAVVPQGYENSWNGGECCGDARAENIDDVAFTRRMVAFISERVCVDPARVFAGGYSNGGYMVYALGCSASDLFAGIGPNAGSLSAEDVFPCSAQTKIVPLFHLHGDRDLTIPYRLGEASVARYRDEIAGCTSGPTISFQNGSATCENWSGCKDNAEVTFCTIEGQGHAWPGCFDGCTAATQDINATREMWYFFKRMTGGL